MASTSMVGLFTVTSISMVETGPSRLTPKRMSPVARIVLFRDVLRHDMVVQMQDEFVDGFEKHGN